MTIHLTILEFKELCGDDCQVSYCYKNGFNVTILDFKNDFLKKEIRPLEIESPIVLIILIREGKQKCLLFKIFNALKNRVEKLNFFEKLWTN